MKNSIVLLLFIVTSVGCSDDNSSSGTSSDTPPVLKNLSIANSQFKSTVRGGVFDLTLSVGDTQKPFLEFGGRLINNESGPGRLNIPFYHLTYQLTTGVEIVAAFDGVIDRVSSQSDSGDCEVNYKASSGSSYMAVVDHISCTQTNGNAFVIAGQTITAGTVLGKSLSNKVEFDITVENRTSNIRDCPLNHLDSNSRSEIEALVTQLMEDVETEKADTSLYDEANMVHPGCNVESGGDS
jgi:hypothetical protein|tara:strand:- start:290 stop:1006 length:717 start_codon:yes stop_codon:yes gene_type:complete